MDRAPVTCHDDAFCGLALGCQQLCREHKLEPQKCVTFGGVNIGRRFYMCFVQNVSAPPCVYLFCTCIGSLFQYIQIIRWWIFYLERTEIGLRYVFLIGSDELRVSVLGR